MALSNVRVRKHPFLSGDYILATGQRSDGKAVSLVLHAVTSDVADNLTTARGQEFVELAFAINQFKNYEKY